MATSDITISHSATEHKAHDTIRQLWQDQDFTDVTLATADGQQVKAHKVILSSCSPFFKDILVKNPHPNPLLYLNNLKLSELQQILEFIYLGQCSLMENDLALFLTKGRDLRISGLNGKDLEQTTIQKHRSKHKKNKTLDSIDKIAASVNTMNLGINNDKTDIKKLNKVPDKSIDTAEEKDNDNLDEEESIVSGIVQKAGKCLQPQKKPTSAQVWLKPIPEEYYQNNTKQKNENISKDVIGRHKESEKDSEDEYSDLDVTWESGFVKNMVKSKSNSKKQYNCKVCEIPYGSEKDLDRHMKAKHR